MKRQRAFARNVLGVPLAFWKPTRVRVFRDEGAQGRVLIASLRDDDDTLFEGIAFYPEKLRKDDVAPIVNWLLDIIEEQGAILEWTVAELDVKAHAARVAGGAKGGAKRRNRYRDVIERLMRACIDKGSDAAEHFANWSETYGYSTRQLRKIWAGIKLEKSKSGTS